MYRGNGGIRRGIYQLQGDDNGHVGRPREVSPARPCPELLCELRGLCRRSYPMAGRGGGRRGSVRASVLLLAVRGIITDPNFSAEFFDGGLVPHGRVGANRNRREGGWTFMKIKCEKCVPAPGIVPWP